MLELESRIGTVEKKQDKVDEYIRGYVDKQAKRSLEPYIKKLRLNVEQALKLSLSTRNYINRLLKHKNRKL